MAAFGIAVVAAVLALRHRGDVQAALSTVSAIGPGHTPDEQIRGLCVLGVILVTLVVIIRLAIAGNGRKDK